MRAIINTLVAAAIFLLVSCGVETFNPDKVGSYEAIVDAAMKESVAEMESERWSPANPKDSGSYGKEVHKRVADKINIDNKAFLGEVWVRQTGINTFEIVSIGSEPGNKTGLHNIDVLRLQTNSSGWIPGDIFTSDQVFGAFEIKTSASGQWSSGQEAKYLLICGNNHRKVALSVPPKRWSFKNKAFIENINYEAKKMLTTSLGAKVFVYGGLAGSAVASLVVYEKLDFFKNQFKHFATRMRNNDWQNEAEKITSTIFIQDEAIQFFGSIDVTGDASGLLRWANPYIVLSEFAYAHCPPEAFDP